MRTVEVNVYKFNELEDDVKEKVLDNYRYTMDFFWTHENEESFKEFGDWIGGLVDWSVGAYTYSRASCKLNWYDWTRGGFDTLAWLKENLSEKECPFTGYYMDEMILKPIREFMEKPDKHQDLQDLADRCADAFWRAYQEDLEFQLSDEYIIDMIEANEWEFTKDGETWS